ncbi:hypothetical protein FAUST_7190 [Fusarium austroamericanum]|uniref:Uncharacterized protein n=1 Tax=Fusarium austroamericanum TaxID=282268 RepID=A0AAN6BYE6_FUSAU|nr:hypothetical protein FAUST_7190 [Fusarium austroamericanum]
MAPSGGKNPKRGRFTQRRSARRGNTLTHDRSVSQSNRGDRDSSTFNHNSTSGQNGQGSSAGVSENTNNPKKCLASVSEVEKREYIGTDGKTTQSIVNTNNTRFAAITHSMGIMGKTNTLEDLSAAGRAIMETGFEMTSFHLEPVTWDNQAMMQAADAERESTSERFWSRIHRQTEQTKLLVRNRKRMPAMRTAHNWYDYLADYLKAGGNETPTEFPWSFDFAADKAGENQGGTIHDLQTTWDASNTQYAEGHVNVAARLGGNPPSGPQHDTMDREDEDMIG